MPPKKLIAITLSAAFLSACGGGGSSSNSAANTPSSPATDSVSLAGVNQMLVAPQGLSVQNTAYAVSRFFKTLVAGFSISDAWAAVSGGMAYVIDAGGKISASDLASIVAGKQSDASSDLLIDSPKFLLFRYQGLNKSGTNEQCVLVGVRKADGKIACISSNPRCDSNSSNVCNVSDYRSQIQVDPSGEIFTTVLGDGSLQSFDLKNPAAPVYTTLFTHQQVGDAAFPILNRYADTFTRINLNSSQNIAYRIYPASGGAAVYSVPTGREVTCGFAGPSSDNANFYYVANLGPAQFSMYKLTRSSTGSFTESLVMSDNSPGQANTLWMNSGGCAQMVHYGDRVFSIGFNQTQMAGHYSNFLYELMNPDIAAGNASPISFTLGSDLLYATNLLGYEGGLVVAGVDATETSHGIQRFNPATNQLSTVLPVGAYRIGSLTVAKNGDITFTGIRISDSTNVLVSIPQATNAIGVRVLNNAPVAIGSVN